MGKRALTFSNTYDLSRRKLLQLAGGAAAAATMAPSFSRSSTLAKQTAGGQIILAWGRFPLTFNPIDPIGGLERTVWQLTSARLINKNVDGDIIPDFAESFEISEDGLTYTFSLAQNATWTDGTPVTARDVVVTYQLAANPATGTYAPASSLAIVEGVEAFLAGESDSISGIQTPDDFTVVFQLSGPDAAFLNFIAGYYAPYLVPAHIVGDVPAAEFAQHPFNTEPVGRLSMGPYIISEAERDQHVVFTRNDTYFQGAPLIDSFIYRVMQPEVALTALLSGEIDVANVPLRDYPTVSQEEGLNVISFRTNLWNGLMFNMTLDEFQDVRIRQAVLHATDREAFTQVILGGLGEPWDSIIVHPQWLSPNIVNYEYDPDKARALLEEAGWDSSRTVEWKYYGSFADLAPVLQQNLAEVGFNIDPIQLETAAWVEAQRAGEFEFSVVGGGGITDDPSELSIFFQPDVWSRYNNPELLELFDQGRVETNLEARREIYNRVQEIANADLPWFPLWASESAVGFANRVTPVGYSLYDFLFYHQWSVTE